MTQITITDQGETMIEVEGAEGTFNGLWRKTTVKKPFVCALSGGLFPRGTRAYRPIARDPDVRLQRIAKSEVTRIRDETGHDPEDLVWG
jgi:hypothetical protein